ncbi:MAG: NAD(P)/FAD-dependent oxidoreductase [Halanaeroarchaeum sp.]
MDVVVVGGGIVGLASAYELARRGATVTVFEKGSLGNGSTERSAGGIRRQFSTPVNVRLSEASLEVWERFDDRFGVDIDFRRNGYLFVARAESSAADLEAAAEMQRDLGVPTDVLDPEEATDVCPALRTARFVRATYLGTDGFADPHLALQGFAQTLPDVGADLRTGTAVTDVSVSDGEVTGVVVDGNRVAADFVVNAAGPWAHEVAAMADVDIPAVPRRRQVVVVDPERTIPQGHPLTIDLDSGAYFRPEREGTALVGGHFGVVDDQVPGPDHYSQSSDLEWRLEALDRAGEVAAYFGGETRIRRGWAGLYSVTPDHHPIIEETLPGFVSAVGFSGHGFQHAPATGKVVADLVFAGRPKHVDVSRLTSDRFERGDRIVERNVA